MELQEFIEKEFKSIRKELRKIRQHIEDPTGEKAQIRSQNNGFRKPQNISVEYMFVDENEEDPSDYLD